MTLHSGALVWARYDEAFPSDAFLSAIRQGRVGGAVLFARNAGSREIVRSAIGALRDAAKSGGLPPPTIAIDEEGGPVSRLTYRTTFPSAMALAAANDPRLVERVGTMTATALRADGIGVNLAPVCDVNTEASNPVIGVRSFGDDPLRVSACVTAWIRGSTAGGVASVAKHFPGHGASIRDTHLTAADVGANRDELDRRDLVPFRAAFAAGAAAAMTAHVRYPALDNLPATLSTRIATALLRNELGFKGLLLSDALEMGGIAPFGTFDMLPSRAIAAGVDTVLVPAELIENAWERIAHGVPAERLATALARARSFRERFALPLSDDTFDPAEAESLAREAAERSITHIGPELPNLERGPIRVVAISSDRPPNGLNGTQRLERALRATFGIRLAFAVDAEPDGEGPLVVCTWDARFDSDRRRRAAPLLDSAAVHCALGSPYDAGLARPLPTLLTYGDVPVSLDALVATLVGTTRAHGESPVRLGLPFC